VPDQRVFYGKGVADGFVLIHAVFKTRLLL